MQSMSITFSLLSKFQRAQRSSALIQRRQRAFVRKIIIVLCAGIMSLLVISSIIDAQATQVIPVASHHIQQGAQLTANDISYVRVPQHDVFHYALTERVNTHNPLITTCEIQTGMPILQNAVSHIPSIPEGFTSINVHLASADHTLIPGEQINLAFSKPLQDEDADNDINGAELGKNSNPASSEHNNESKKAEITTIDKRYVSIIQHVMVLHITQNQQSAQNQQNTTTLAMPAADALRLLQAQSANPSLAIVAMKHSK
ncbi:hypothetical protein [Gardnerella vaginalis]|uniref:hypothetical protein n=1 Tax=Gardnerella TaxID=2701 RepID=UPI000353BEFF|nr:hypothetical protein [Gardnerella vaginalis]EPI43992.1 hypothetical protein HMPREF1585_00263 [Gardnerella vaginalis JCP8481B]EPI44854.1 hypothetical protein HMPREF1584_00082 [Gardnerella vaginalis JCP8481A]